MDRKDQLSQLISLNQDRIESCQKLMASYQGELRKLQEKENRPMDQRLQEYYRELSVAPEDFELRQRATACALRAQQGLFAAWRTATDSMPPMETVEIEQPIFVSENVLTEAPLIKQSFQVSLLLDSITDLMKILPLQPNGLIALPQNALHYFSSLPKAKESAKYNSSDFGPESKYHVLYDTAWISRGGTVTTFFTAPLGVSDRNDENNIPKTYAETNMIFGSSIPHPYSFELHGISVIPAGNIDYPTALEFIQSTWFRLFIGTRDWMITPTIAVGVTTGKKPAGFNFALSNPVEPVHVLPQPVLLEPLLNFRLEVNSVFNSQRSFQFKALLHGFLKNAVALPS